MHICPDMMLPDIYHFEYRVSKNYQSHINYNCLLFYLVNCTHFLVSPLRQKLLASDKTPLLFFLYAQLDRLYFPTFLTSVAKGI